MLIPEWAPNVHPLLVHFPLVLLLGAILVQIGEFFIPWLKQNSWITTLAYGLGWISGIVTYFAGKAAADSVTVADNVIPALSRHADLATQTIAVFGAVLLIRIIFHFATQTYRIWINVLAFIIALIGGNRLVETGEHGAMLVYRYGVGTQKQVVREEAALPTDNMISVNDDGWSWIDVGVLPKTNETDFTWIGGSQSWTKVLSDENSLSEGETVTLLSKRSMDNMVGTADLDLEGFNGKVELLFHYKNDKNYDFLSLGTGTVKIGRMEKGTEKVFESGAYGNVDDVELKLIANGHHLRGYLNNKLMVHAHAEAGPEAETGIRISGPGRVHLHDVSYQRQESEH